ncbi:MAG TPA: hypothetical protein VFY49_18315 [Myxococcota bacterium]|nr:hypothetical protein [Myxococcota bacterium]
MRRTLPALAALGIAALASPLARAECVDDCTDTYQQAMATCQQQYASPGQEDQLQDCMDDAQEQLETCTNDCESVD